MDITDQLAQALMQLKTDSEAQLKQIEEQLNVLQLDILVLQDDSNNSGMHMPNELHESVMQIYPNKACSRCAHAIWHSTEGADERAHDLNFNCQLHYSIEEPVLQCSKQTTTA